MTQYLWQLSGWNDSPAPAFQWQTDMLLQPLADIQNALGNLLPAGLPPVADTTTQLHIDAIVQTALRSSEIEGEILDVRSVRSSVVNKLGLEQAGAPALGTPQTDALAELLIAATSKLSDPLSKATLRDWQAALFVESNPLQTINIGDWRGEQVMQVVSGRIDRPTVHFEAPPRDVLDEELTRFIDWFNRPPSDLNPYIRAAITHLWFVTLHPFDDGNGRVTRALTDRALAQAEDKDIRFYSHSAAIMARRNEYYTRLESAQKGTLNITPWLTWFFSTLVDAIDLSKTRFEQVLYKTRFWQRHAQTVLNEREIKVLNRLLDAYGEEFIDGINASKYKSLGQVSKATATRELTDLLSKGCLSKMPGGGRSTRYQLPQL